MTGGVAPVPGSRTERKRAARGTTSAPRHGRRPAPVPNLLRQARAAIASTSFHCGKRPVAFLEYTSSPARVISISPPEPFTSSMSASSIWESLSLTRSASGSYPQAPQYSILNFIDSSPDVPPARGARIHPHRSVGHLAAYRSPGQAALRPVIASRSPSRRPSSLAMRSRRPPTSA